MENKDLEKKNIPVELEDDALEGAAGGARYGISTEHINNLLNREESSDNP